MNMNPHFDRHITDEQAREAYERLWQDRSDKLLNAVPDYMHGGFYRWVVWGIYPDDFLTAVISNNLMRAVLAADDDNQRALVDWARLFYNAAPCGCFGSTKRLDEWHKAGGLFGRCEVCQTHLGIPGNPQSSSSVIDGVSRGICTACATEQTQPSQTQEA